MRSPLLRGEELDDREKSTQEAVELRQTGIEALVELTLIGLGRDPRGVAGIAAHSGLHIVLATGIHREAHYPPKHLGAQDRTRGPCRALHTGHQGGMRRHTPPEGG